MHLVSKLVKNTKEDIQILLDEHAMQVKSMNSLEDYIRIKAFTSWHFDHEIYIHITNSKNSKLIQAVDLAANAIYAKYNYNRNHLYNMLKIDQSIKFPSEKFNT